MANLIIDYPPASGEAEYKLRAKKVIEDAVALFNDPNGAAYMPSRHLWNVLTALRGPDSDNTTLKEVTTARIRGVVGMAIQFNNTGAVVSDDRSLLPELETDHKSYSREPTRHFQFHYGLAAKALRYFGFAALFLFAVELIAGDKTNLKPTFRYEGKTYVIDSIKAHEAGAMSVEFSPSEDGKWYVFKPEPEMGRHIHHQVR